jgi:hypothetical protein
VSRTVPEDPFAGWPPVIESAAVPRAVKLRDGLLTLLMWGVLLLILASELRLAWVAFEVARGRSEAEIDLALAEFLEKLRPLMQLVGGLVVALALATLLSRARRERAIAARQPCPLPEEALARRAGLAGPALAEARGLRRAIVHRLPEGGIRVEEAGGAGGG